MTTAIADTASATTPDFFSLFSRSADICSRDRKHVTNRASIDFDFHDRVYATLGEDLKVLDIDDTICEEIRSPDGLPFICVGAPHISDDQSRAGRRFVAATTKSLHIYSQPSVDSNGSVLSSGASQGKSSSIMMSPRREPLASISVVGAVPMRQRIISMSILGEDQSSVVALTSQEVGCVHVFTELILQSDMHSGNADTRWGNRNNGSTRDISLGHDSDPSSGILSDPQIVCGTLHGDVVIVDSGTHKVESFSTSGDYKGTLINVPKTFEVSAACMDSDIRLNVAFRPKGAEGGGHVDVYGPVKRAEMAGRTPSYQLLWRFNDDGLAPLEAPVAICVGGDNNVAILDRRKNVPFPNVVSWDEAMVEDRLDELKDQDSKLSSQVFSDSKYGFNGEDDNLVRAENRTKEEELPAKFSELPRVDEDMVAKWVDVFESGGLLGRRGAATIEAGTSSTIIIKPMAVRIRRTDTIHPSQCTLINSRQHTSAACEFSIVLADGSVPCTFTSEFKLRETDSAVDAIFNFDGETICFPVNAVENKSQFAIRTEVKMGGVGVQVPESLGAARISPSELGLVPDQMGRVAQLRLFGGNIDKLFKGVQHTVSFCFAAYIEPGISRIKAAAASAGSTHFIPDDFRGVLEDRVSGGTSKGTTRSKFDVSIDTTLPSAPSSKELDTPTLLFGKLNFKENEMDSPLTQIAEEPMSSRDEVCDDLASSYVSPPTSSRAETDEIITIRDIISELTKPLSPAKGLVWKVGSTGGTKLRAYMSLRNMCTTTPKLCAMVGRELTGTPISIILSDLAGNIPRIRCAAALLLLSLAQNDPGNQRLLCRMPGFTSRVKCQDGSIVAWRVFWVPLSLRSEYLTEITRRNHRRACKRPLLSADSVHKDEKPSEHGFMHFLRRRLTSAISLEYTSVSTNGMLASRDNLSTFKSHTHSSPMSFGCYPSCRKYDQCEDVELDTLQNADSAPSEGTTKPEERGNTRDIDKQLLEWCPDPASHLLSFPIISNLNDYAGGNDSIASMNRESRLRQAFDRLGGGVAVPHVRIELLQTDPVILAALGEDMVDGLASFFQKQGDKNTVTWLDVCDYRRFKRYQMLSIEQSTSVRKLELSPVLLKRFSNINVSRMQADKMSKGTDTLLSNVEVWVNAKKKRLRVDLKLYPSDGSKYRAYIVLDVSKYGKSYSETSLLTLKQSTLLQIKESLLLPHEHIVNQPVASEPHAASVAILENGELDLHGEIIEMVQIRKGGKAPNLKALFGNQKSTISVLRLSLRLGGELWRQARVQHAFDLMQEGAKKSIDMMPVKASRSKHESIVLDQLFNLVKRSKLVGRRDPAMAVMLLRSCFAQSLERLLRSGKENEQAALPLPPKDASIEKGQGSLTKRLFENNRSQIVKIRKKQHDMLELREKQVRDKMDRLKKRQEVHRSLQKQKKIELQRKKREQKARDLKAESTLMNMYYAEGKKLEAARERLLRKENQQRMLGKKDRGNLTRG